MPTKADLEKQITELKQQLADTKRRLREAQDFITGGTELTDPETVKREIELLREEDDAPF